MHVHHAVKWDTSSPSPPTPITEEEGEMTSPQGFTNPCRDSPAPDDHSESELDESDDSETPELMSIRQGENLALARSYDKLSRAPLKHFKQEEETKCHKWLKMQREWLDNIEEDPDSYFDDFL